jgi:predicted DNA-binding transcriptional regulator YafY
MSGADEQILDRMLRILHRLRSAPSGLTEAELASACGIPPATVRADLRLLSECANVPVWNEAEEDLPADDDGDDDDGGGDDGGGDDDDSGDEEAGIGTVGRPWHLDSDGYTLPPLPLTPMEAWALVETLSGVGVDSMLATAQARIRKALLGVGPKESPVDNIVVKGVRPVYDPDQPEGLLRRLEKAVSLRRRVRIWYRSAAGDCSERKVDPYGLLYYWVQGTWYLVGRCHQTGEARTFRADRLRRIQELDERFAYPADFSLEEYFRQAWGVDRGIPRRVAIRFFDHFNVFTRLRKETAHRRDARLTPEPGGTLLYTDTVAGLNEIRVWVRSFGESAEALEPAELRDSILESALQILERYGIGPATGSR